MGLSLSIVVPPAEVRYRVASQEQSEEQYLRVGETCAEEIVVALRSLGHDARSFRRVLDFGCGCSRVLQPLHRSLVQAELYGSDIDRVGVEWSRGNIAYAKSEVNGAMPPLCYNDTFFDFIYALSVFSHLDADVQREWLHELDRVLMPGGIVYFTFSGPFVLNKVKNDLDIRHIDEFNSTGFTFVHNISDKILPDWYQTSLQNIYYLQGQFPPSFELLKHLGQGCNGWQDMLSSGREDCENDGNAIRSHLASRRL